MRLTVARLAWLLLPVIIFAAVDAHAQRDRRAKGNDGADGRDLSDTVRRVERSSGGEVLSAERVPFDGRSVHRVKVLDASGRVRVYMDDPLVTRRRDPVVPPRTRDNDD